VAWRWSSFEHPTVLGIAQDIGYGLEPHRAFDMRLPHLRVCALFRKVFMLQRRAVQAWKLGFSHGHPRIQMRYYSASPRVNQDKRASRLPSRPFRFPPNCRHRCDRSPWLCGYEVIKHELQDGPSQSNASDRCVWNDRLHWGSAWLSREGRRHHRPHPLVTVANDRTTAFLSKPVVRSTGTNALYA
jgi:hypothetical protein